MTTTLTRRVVRETSVIDHRTRRPWLIALEEGGKLVRVWVKGCRRAGAFTVPIQAIVVMGAKIKAGEIRAAKAERRRLRRELNGRTT